MFAYEPQHEALYKRVKPYMKCKCSNPSWTEVYQEATGLTIVYCANCQQALTFDQFDSALREYSFDTGYVHY